MIPTQAPISPDHHKPGSHKHVKVFHDRCATERLERFDERAGGLRRLGQRIEHLAPYLVGQGPPDAVVLIGRRFHVMIW